MNPRYRMRFSYFNLSGKHFGKRMFNASTDEEAREEARKWVEERSKGWNMKLLGLRRIIQPEESVCVEI